MSFDFDQPIERRGTDSQKWQKYVGRDVLPMWVADMDFAVAPAIRTALHERVEHGVFGYARPVKSTVDAVIEMFQRQHGWEVHPAWLVWLPGLVVGLNVMAQAYADAGDEVLTLTPVYPPFMSAPKHSGRVSVQVPFVHTTSVSRWEIDWDALERAVTPRTKIFFLCNPHNPLARVWRRDELERLGEFCLRHDLVLCSDEIHCDLILDPALRHVCSASLSPELARRTVTLTAPSKTYNIPGLGTSLAVIPDATLRAQFVRATAGIVAEVTSLGFTACEAAYRHGEPWRQELLAYLRGNRDLIVDFVARELPGITIEAPIEATYLAWLNVSALNLADAAGHFEAHGVGLSDGAYFASRPGRHLRLNFGCTRATLQEALQRMKRAVAATS
ncbi:MalY/PatB family protein [Opitutus terrae]|uniref:cysteine-S-conjugate beta-lyase n=1 Tax=Opitutus terrae (strain DSM 11246 / JCM 15787 / PB90-1) TaxID=452637 RepID=B1ZWU3_OPITP|nr:PatB family C-S lyase [Opitutus terrae]ACB74220.1 aminotransferase class I and II [Opitutus terrae PB90-1]